MTDEQEEEEGLSAISSVTVRLERAFQVRSTSTNDGSSSQYGSKCGASPLKSKGKRGQTWLLSHERAF